MLISLRDHGCYSLIWKRINKYKILDIIMRHKQHTVFQTPTYLCKKEIQNQYITFNHSMLSLES